MSLTDEARYCLYPIFPGYSEFKNQDYAAALTKLQPVAERGNADAQTMLGNLYQLGLGVEVDSARAIAWYEKASAQGYGIASNNLAGMRLIEGQVEASKRLYQLAREQGFEHTPARS